jgi:ubiquinone/menaquinone biosynthesis C-methylase UbiE
VPDPDVVLSEVFRVLKSDGKVAFTFPDERIRDGLKDFFDAIGLYSIFLKNIPKRTEWHINKLTFDSFTRMLPVGLYIESHFRVPLPVVGDTYFVGCKKN